MEFMPTFFSFFELKIFQWFKVQQQIEDTTNNNNFEVQQQIEDTKNNNNNTASNSTQLSYVEKNCYIFSNTKKWLPRELKKYVLNNTKNIHKVLKKVSPTATDCKGNTLLHYVSEIDSDEIVKYLGEACFYINAKNIKGKTALIKAIIKNNEKTVKALITLGANLHHKYYRQHRGPLLIAVEEGHINLINILLEAGCDVNAKEEYQITTPLMSAVRNKNLEAAKILLDAGANYDNAYYYRGKGPLELACQKKHLKIVELLLDVGCNVLARDPYGYTPLHWTLFSSSSQKGDEIVDIMKVLIQAGADVNAQNNIGRTPLHAAIDYGEKVVDLLLKSGAQPDVMDNRGYTPLQQVARQGNKYILSAELLIKAGANINKIHYTGETCLHFAARWKSIKMLNLFLKNGAQLELPNHYDQDALDYAVFHWNYGIRSFCGSPYSYEPKDYETVINDRKGNKEIEDQIRCIELLCKHRTKMDCVMSDGYFKFYNHSKVIRVLLRKGMIVDFKNPYVREVLERSSFKSKLSLTLIRHAAVCNNYKNGRGIINFDLEIFYEKQKEYYADCLDELKNLNVFWVYETMPLFNLIEGKVSSRYILNEDLMQAFKTGKISNSFPIFNDELTERFETEFKKYELISKATAGLQSLIKLDENAFDLIYCNIMRYLNTDDQRTLASLIHVKTS